MQVVKTEAEANSTITIERDDKPNLRFAGRKIATASSYHYQGPRQNRYTELALYQTRAGKYVLSKRYITRWQGEEGSSVAEVFADVAALQDYLGTGNLAKELYEEAGIECVEMIE